MSDSGQTGGAGQKDRASSAVDGARTRRESGPGTSPEHSDPRNAEISDLFGVLRTALSGSCLPDTLLSQGRLSDEILDLTHAHPSGLATLMAGRATRLSSLVRETDACTTALRQVRVIRADVAELAEDRGIRSGYLAAGLACWRPPIRGIMLESGDMRDDPFLAPILLRGCALRPRDGDQEDYDVDLDDTVVVNPVLLDVLAEEYGVHVDGDALARLSFGPEGFDPLPVYARLEDAGETVPDFWVEPRLLVGSFTAGSGVLLRDLVMARPALRTHRLLAPLFGGRASGDPASGDPVPGGPASAGPDAAAREPGRDAFPEHGSVPGTGEAPGGTGQVPGRSAEGPGGPAEGSGTRHRVTCRLPGAGRLLARGCGAGTVPGPGTGTDGSADVEDCAREPEDEWVDRADRLLDLDPQQHLAVAAVLEGRDVVVEGPPGTGNTHTIAAAAVGLAAMGRTVLLLTPHRATADELIARLEHVGMGDHVLDLHDGHGRRPRLLSGLGLGLESVLGGQNVERAEEALAQAPTGAAEAFDTAVTGLASSCEALHVEREPWGVSAYEAMVALAGLMAGPNAPRTRVRLPLEVTRRLNAGARERLRGDLRDAAAHGAFTMTRLDTRWLDARVFTDADAERALAAARAARDGLNRARGEMRSVATSAGLADATTVAGWRPQLELLFGVRDTLDLLLPGVFEAPLDDLIAVTAPEGSPEHPGPERLEQLGGRFARRALRRRARSMVRPGVHVPNVHDSLVTARRQRDRWQQLARCETLPQVPTGLADAGAAVTAVEGALAVLTAALSGTGTPNLRLLPLDKLEQRLADLAGDEDGIRAQPRRTQLLDQLNRAGLGDLLSDLRQRKALPDDVDGELDLAWWTSVLEATIRGDARLARHDAAVLRKLTMDLRAADGRRATRATAAARLALARRAARTVRAHPRQVRWLRSEVYRGHRSVWPADLFRNAPCLVTAFRPIWVMSPDAVARVLPSAVPGDPFLDAVMIDDAGQVGLAEAAAVMARARQVVVAGDRRRLPPATGGPSVLSVLAEHLPVRRMFRDHRSRDSRLLAPMRDCYPEGWSAVPPSAGTSPLVLEYVADGIGVPPPGQQLAVSAEAEVRRVVALVTDHAVRRPGESLAVVTFGTRHANRISAQLRTAAGGRPELAEWLAVHTAPANAEPFVIRPVHRIAGIVRDAVIVTVGLSRTPHGRVVHRFGVLDGRFGQACLVAALSRSRRRTTVVSSFTAADLVDDRLRSDGARMLRRMLQVSQELSGVVVPPAGDGPPAPVYIGTVPTARGGDPRPVGDREPQGRPAPCPTPEPGGAAVPAAEPEPPEESVDLRSASGPARDPQGPQGPGEPVADGRTGGDRAAVPGNVPAVSGGTVAPDGEAGGRQDGAGADGGTGPAGPGQDAAPAMPGEERDVPPGRSPGRGLAGTEGVDTVGTEGTGLVGTGAVDGGAARPPARTDTPGRAPAVGSPAGEDRQPGPGDLRPRPVRWVQAGTEPPDALVADLCDRLAAAGMPLMTGVPAPDWPLDIAVGDPHEPGRWLLAVEIDSPVYSRCRDIRLRDWQRPRSFERAGWTHVRVAAMDLFCDPGEVVERIQEAWRTAGGMPLAAGAVAPPVVLYCDRGPRPAIRPGRPFSSYTGEELDAVARWLLSDGRERDEDRLVEEIRAELELAGHGARSDAMIGAAARRALAARAFGFRQPRR